MSEFITEWSSSEKYLRASTTLYWLQEENQALQLQNVFIKHNVGTELSRLKLWIGHFALLILRTESRNNLPKK